jgi:excinuclease ABC subunit C
MVESTLDEVPGLGEVRRKTLLRHFGSLKKLRGATVDEVADLPGFGPRLAESVVLAVNAAATKAETGRAPAINMATGEILGDDVPAPAGQQPVEAADGDPGRTEN